MRDLPILFSKDLDVIPVHEDGLPWVFSLHSSPEVAQFNTIGIPTDLQSTKRVLSKRLDPLDDYNLGWMIQKKNDSFVGEIGLVLAPKRFKKAEISYSIHPNFWNKGYATAAIKAVLKYAFEELEIHRIEAGVAVENTASIHVLKKTGFQREGRHRSILPLSSGWSDSYAYAILLSDWQKTDR